MKNIKDFLKALNAKLNIPEIEGWIAASDINAVEISEEAASELEDSVKGLLTVEAAKNNKGLKTHFKQNLYDSIKGELLGNVDTQLQKMTHELFGEDAASEMEKAEFTKDKFRVFQELLSDHQVKQADDKTKLQIDGLKKQLEKNEAAYKKKEEQFQSEMKKITDGMNEKLTRAEISRRISSKQFAEKYDEDDMKNILTQTAIERINKEAVIKINDNGELATFDRESPDMEYFSEDGTHMGVDDLINKHIGKYLAKSEPQRTVKREKIYDQPKDKEAALYQNPGISSLGKAIATGDR